MNTAISIKNLSFGYQKTNVVLKNITLDIKTSSISMLLGKNGCGKSTLIDCIVGFLGYTDGTIFINGQDLKQLSNREQARQLAYIPQSISADVDYTLLEFILFGRNCHIRLGASPEDADYHIAIEAAEKCGIGDLLYRNIREISGGERQLAYIARALAQQSQIIVMDEPTSALDVSNQHLVLSLLKRLVLKENKTILLSSHNPNHALYLDCNVFLMKDGSVLGSGSAREMVTVEKLKPIYGDDVCLSVEQEYREISFKD